MPGWIEKQRKQFLHTHLPALVSNDDLKPLSGTLFHSDSSRFLFVLCREYLNMFKLLPRGASAIHVAHFVQSLLCDPITEYAALQAGACVHRVVAQEWRVRRVMLLRVCAEEVQYAFSRVNGPLFSDGPVAPYVPLFVSYSYCVDVCTCFLAG